MTTGEGGIVVTNDDDLAARAQSLRNLCFQPGKRFVHERLGWNYRMTNMQAALGLAQLERLLQFVERKKGMGALYHKLLSGTIRAQLPLVSTTYADNVYWVFGLVQDESLKMDAEEAMTRLAGRGVGTRPFFCPMHMQPVLRRMGFFAEETYPVAERLYRYGFYIPSGLAITPSQIQFVAKAVSAILQ